MILYLRDNKTELNTTHEDVLGDLWLKDRECNVVGHGLWCIRPNLVFNGIRTLARSNNEDQYTT